MNCNICIEPIKKDATCLYCNYNVCLQCLKRYFKESNKINCMNCNKEYTRKYISKNFSKRFLMIDYKQIKENIIFSHEMSYIIKTHEEIEYKNQLFNLKKLEDDFYYINKFNKDLKLIYNKKYLDTLNPVLNNITSDLTQQINEISINIKNKNKKIIEFIGKCSIDNCNGLISKIKKQCNLCFLSYCIKCLDQTNDKDHECDKNILETMKFLKNYKNCPSCFMKILKIDGCDQMFCTNCNTGFDWITLKIIKKGLHNPHYLEYLRTNNQQVNITCQLELNNLVLEQLVSMEHNNKYAQWITYICINLIHIKDIEIRENNLEDFTTNLDLRISYIRKQITESIFKKKIQEINKKNEKKKDLENILELFITLGTDIILRYTQTNNPKETWQELVNTKLYINNLINEHNLIYNSISKKRINEKFIFV